MSIDSKLRIAGRLGSSAMFLPHGKPLHTANVSSSTHIHIGSGSNNRPMVEN